RRATSPNASSARLRLACWCAQLPRGAIASLSRSAMAEAFASTTRPEFARELPQFLADVRRIFSRYDIAAYFEALEQDAGVPNSGPHAKKLQDSGLLMSTADKKARIKRLHQLKAMRRLERGEACLKVPKP